MRGVNGTSHRIGIHLLQGHSGNKSRKRRFCSVVIFCKFIMYLLHLQRDHFRLKKLLIVLGVETVLSALQILFGTFLVGLIGVAFHGYGFVVINSLFLLFEEEYVRGFHNRITPHSQLQYAEKV